MKQVADTNIWVPDHDEHFSAVKKGVPVAANYQRTQLDAALALVRKFDTAVDAGAHVGLMTCVLAQKFDRVLAFEPAADVFECLEKNTAGLINVHRHNAALGAAAGRIGIDVDYEDNTGARQVNPAGSDVPLVALDDLRLTHLDFIKLDVQGYEYAVLKGARDTLAQCKPVCMVEVEDPRKLPRSFGDPHKAIRLLEKLGAKVRRRIGHDWILAWD